MDGLARVGGTDGLRAIVTEFYARVFDDLMIGYLFKGLDRARLIELEVQFTARAAGLDIRYEGRGMRAAHGHLAISLGQFQRRYVILAETLRDLAVDGEFADAWLGHVRALRRAVVKPPVPGAACPTPADSAPGLGDEGPRGT